MQACLIVYIKMISQSSCVYSRLNADLGSLALLTLRTNQWAAKRSQLRAWCPYNLIVHRNCFTDFTHFDISCSSIKMPSERRKNAPVRQFAAGIDNAGKLPLNSDGKEVWRCQKCIDSGRHRHPREWIASGGTVAFAKHLAKDHSILITSSTQAARALDALRSTKLQQQALFRPKQRLLSSDSDLDGRALRAHFLAWIVADNLSRSIAKSPFFRSFLQYISPNANELLPRDPKTIRGDLRCAVNGLKSYVQRSLSTALSRVHIICDAWTSPNGYAIWGIQAQYLDSKSDLQCITIGLERLQSSHDGRSLASVTYAAIEHYGFAKSLGYAILDNASTNDTLANTLASRLSDIDVNWDPIQHRIRCFGHIVNLAASAFIYIDPKDMPPADDAAG